MADTQLLEDIRSRKSRSGVITADRYFHDAESCVGGLCPVANQKQWKESLEDAGEKLTYSNPNMEIVKSSIKGMDDSSKGILQFDAIVTTPKRDRDGDVLLTEGATLDMKMSLLWQHMPMSPIGAMTGVIEHTKDFIKARFVIANTSLGRDAAELIKVGALRISHGFNPVEFELMEDEEGWLFKKFEIFEVSLVSIPSNTDAVLTAVSEKKFETDFVKNWAKGIGAGKTNESTIVEKSESCSCQKGPEQKWYKIEPESSSHPIVTSKEFDVERQHVDAAKLEYDWVSRFCSCEVKQLVNLHTESPRIKMGSFLRGLQLTLDEMSVQVDARRLTRNGTETPLEYEQIQLNSKNSDNFLVDGISFRKAKSGECFAVKYTRTWRGVEVEFYCSEKDYESLPGVLGKAWGWADKNNFLKGEAFSLGGEFLPKTSESWGDVFLEPENEKAIKRVVENLNNKGKECPNRGVVMMGPPGTGKTLSGRLIKNHCKATFIWICGKDAYYFGGINAVVQAFELAKELAPSVVFMEDIDASLTSAYATDVLKTEMDGIGRSTGVATVLTTNHPKSFPEALLDRPGRFHDVLKFDLPKTEKRKAMIEKWVEGIGEKALLKAVESTEGYSGAHVYELCQYSLSLKEQEDVEINAAVELAIKKIDEQRELINSELMSDRRMAGRRRFVEIDSDKPVKSSHGLVKRFEFKEEGEDVSFHSKDLTFEESERVFFSRVIQEPSDSLRKCVRRLESELQQREDSEIYQLLESY